MKRVRPVGVSRKQWDHQRYLAHKESFRQKHANYYAANREQRLQYSAALDAQTKLDVLSHYGKNGLLQCCWSGCEVNDPDMLSLDHLNNDGAQDRRQGKAGIKHYRILKKENFPDGLQTLCYNHQWKKELMRRRNEES